MRNSKIDQYLTEGCMRCPLGGTSQCKVLDWTKELERLRSIVLKAGLKEELKWGVPCYTYNDNNVLLVSAFRSYCAISFFKGVLVEDPKQILSKPGPNSQSSRLIKITDLNQILEIEKEILALIQSAIENEKAGLKVSFKTVPEPMPEELKKKLEQDPLLKSAFQALTPGRQRGYILYISQAKQTKTRVSRIEKCVPKILNGEGLHDKYKGKKK
jgi:uncharacterized protein YdeI (YjbR/CyaY-like superfamily)